MAIGHARAAREPIGFLIGRNLKRLRAAARLRQLDVAMTGGVNPQRVSDLERGAMPNPSAEVVAGIARGLSITVDELLNQGED